MSLPIIDSPIPLELNEMWSSYDYLVECFGEDDPEIEKLFDDLYGMRRSSNDSKMIPNEFLELIYERHEDPNKLYGLVHSLYEYWEIEMTLYKSLRKLEEIVGKEFWESRNLCDDTDEYPMEMLKKIFKVNVKELV